MKRKVCSSLLLAILGSCLPFVADAFVNPSGKKHTSILPLTSSGVVQKSASQTLVRRFLSEQNSDDDEKTPSVPPAQTPSSDITINEEAELEVDSTPPSQKTVEAERPQVPVSVTPSPPIPKLQLEQTKKPTQPSRSLTPDEEKLAVASGLGGLVAGAMLGVLIDFENPNIDLTMSPILPPVFCAIFVSSFSYSLGGSEGGLGRVVRTVFGGPTVVTGNVITSIIEAIVNNAVTSAKNKVKETTDDIKAIPGKIADEIKATPGRVADAAVETATEIAEEIKATPGKVADAAVETATEIADEIKATPGRVVKQTKQAVEDVVDDTLDAVEDFVDDVKAIPQKAIDGVESALGVSKPEVPRPPLAPRSVNKKTPLPPKELPASFQKKETKGSLIPNITSLKAPDPPKFNIPKIDISKPSKTSPKESSSDNETVEAFKFGLPKIDISKTQKLREPKTVSAPKKVNAKKVQPKKINYSFPSETPPSKTGISKFELPKFGSSPPKPSSASNPESGNRAVEAAKKEAKIKAETNRLRQVEKNREKIEAAEKAKEIKRQKQLEAKQKAADAAEAAMKSRLTKEKEQQEIKARKIEAAEKAKEMKRQKQLEARQKADTLAQEAAERRRFQEQERQEKIEAQRLAAEKRRQESEEQRRQAELIRKNQATKARELQEEKKAAERRAERRQVAAKSIGQAQSRTTISLGNLFGGNAIEETGNAVEEANELKTSKPPPGVPVVSNWKQNPDGSISGRISGSPNFTDDEFITTSSVAQGATSNSVVMTSSGSRYFLQQKQAKGFSFGFGTRKTNIETDTETPPEDEKPTPATAFAAKRKAAGEAKRFSFGFGTRKTRETVTENPTEDGKPSPATAFAAKKKAAGEAKRLAAEDKKAKAAALAEQRRAAAEAKLIAAEEKKAKASALAEQRRAAAEAKSIAAEEKKAKAAALAEAKRVAAEEKKAKAAALAEGKRVAAEEKKAKAAAQAEAKKVAAEEKKANAAALAEQRRAVAEAKRLAAEEKRAKASALAEQQRAAADAKKNANENQKAKLRSDAEQNRKSASFKSTGFLKGNRAFSNATPAPKAESPPKGVPLIKSWKKRSDGGVSGQIYSSPNFEDGDFIETSPISKGKIENGSIVSTKSRSRYFLSSETVAKESNIMAAFKDLAGAKPGATITLTKERKEREAKTAIEAIEKAKPRSTFSLFGLALGDLDEGSSSKSDPIKTDSKKKASAPKIQTAPKGVPTLSRWKLNRDGSISGFISGSINFNEGERVTTSMIADGRMESGEVVTTGSGSQYFLA